MLKQMVSWTLFYVNSNNERQYLTFEFVLHVELFTSRQIKPGPFEKQ